MTWRIFVSTGLLALSLSIVGRLTMLPAEGWTDNVVFVLALAAFLLAMELRYERRR